MNNRSKFLQQLTVHEGSRKRMYKCSAGFNTIGVGHNLDANPISELAIQTILNDDVAVVEQEINSIFTPKELSEMGDVRYYTLLNIAFNLGIPTLKKFKKTIQFIKAKDWYEASKEILRSRWAVQVGNRSKQLSEQLRTGEWNQ